MEKEFMKYTDTAEILKAIAHPIRLCIISNLLQKGESNVTDMQDCLGIPQSTLSQHLQKLRGLKILEGRRNGLEVFYSVSDVQVAHLISELIRIKLPPDKV